MRPRGSTVTEEERSAESLPRSAFNQGYFEQYVIIELLLIRFFVVQSELGRGARGVVLKVTHVLDNIALGDYAVKRVHSISIYVNTRSPSVIITNI